MKPTRRSAGVKGGRAGSTNGDGLADRHEKLQYMSDLILQLKRMAEGSGLNELAGALGRAHDMARRDLKSQEGD